MIDFWWLPIAFAPCVGSFLGVVIARLPAGRAFAFARSECESCSVTLRPEELVPIWSYLASRGTCRHCGARIAPFHLAIECAALGVAVWSASVDPDPSAVWVDCGLGWTLLALAWIDARHLWLPDVLTLPLLVFGLFVSAWWTPDETLWHALGAIGGYTAFRTIAVAYRRLRGIDGLGDGDAKLLAASGAWLGLAMLPIVAMGAAVIGIATIFAKKWAGKAVDARTHIPFGPALATATWLAWLYRNSLN